MTTTQNLKIPTEWERIEGIRVLDGDGWHDKSWDEPITVDEFHARASVSTCEMRVRP